MLYYVLKEMANKVSNNNLKVTKQYNAGRPVMVTEDISAAKACFERLMKKHVPCILAGENPFKASPAIYAFKAARRDVVDSYYSGLMIIEAAEWRLVNSGMKVIRRLQSRVDIFRCCEKKIESVSVEEMFYIIDHWGSDVQLCSEHRNGNRVSYKLVPQVQERRVYHGLFEVVCCEETILGGPI